MTYNPNNYELDREAMKEINPQLGNRANIKNGCVPPPPKPGEIMICQYCGQPMYPEHFSKNPITRKREFKWHLHEYCMMKMQEQCDLQTVGLTSERNNLKKRREENMPKAPAQRKRKMTFAEKSSMKR